MDFTLTEEQRILRDTLARFMDTGPRDTELAGRWQALADLGALGIGFPEALGGLGGGLREMELVLEAAGENRRTEPLIDALAIPGAMLARIDPDRLAELGTGTAILVSACAEVGDPMGLSPRVTLRSGALTGQKALVPSGAGAGSALVSARDGQRILLAEAALGDVPTQPMMDGQTGLRLDFDATPAIVLAAGEDAEEAIRAGWRHGMHAIAAFAQGIARGMFDATLAYVRVREQFGQPIGRFQVIQHRLADMSIALEESRALIDMARHALQDDGPDADLIMARTGVLDRCVSVGRAAIQLHGGIGMSEEMPLGAGFRALKVLQGRFGGDPYHLAALRAAS